MTLTVIWLVTAAVALILTVVYFERLQKLYDEIDSKNPTDVVNDTGAAQGVNIAEADPVPGEDPSGVSDISEGVKQQSAENGYGAETASGTQAVDDPGSDESQTGQGASDGGNIADNAANTAEGTGTGNDPDGNAPGTADGNAEGDPESSPDTDTGVNSGDTEGISTDETGTESISEENNTAEDTSENGEKAGGKAKEGYDYSLGIDPEKPVIALSFDDGPSIYTERILEALQKNHVEATFFMVGYNVRNYKDKVKLVYEAGMEIGNHTTDHKDLSKLSKDGIWSQIFDNEDLINSVVPAGRIPVRPPYGSYNSTVRSVVVRPMFNWSVDSLDWKTKNADSIVAQIKQDARDGYIILMHDLYETTAEAAERIIPWLIDEGYQVTCIGKMFKARGVATEDGTVYRYVPAAGE